MNWKQALALGLCSVGAYAEPEDQWEVLYEGTVTTEETNRSPISSCGGLKLNSVIDSGIQGVYRLTVDGVTISKTFQSSTVTSVHIGNEYLQRESAEDSGENFYVAIPSIFGFYQNFSFYSRNPGTYHVKIERKL